MVEGEKRRVVPVSVSSTSLKLQAQGLRPSRRWVVGSVLFVTLMRVGHLLIICFMSSLGWQWLRGGDELRCGGMLRHIRLKEQQGGRGEGVSRGRRKRGGSWGKKEEEREEGEESGEEAEEFRKAALCSMTQTRKRPSSALLLNDECDGPGWIRTAHHRQPHSADKDTLGLLIQDQYIRLFEQGKTVEVNGERLT